MNTRMHEASRLAAQVYKAFMGEVIEAHVVADRDGPLTDRKRRDLETGRGIDTRVIRLMSISGKGGHAEDPQLRARYAESANVTLLDHLLSVVRGAITFAALDLLSSHPDLDLEPLGKELRVLAALAFMHDLDKDLGLTRDAPLPLEAVAERWAHYGLGDFVGEAFNLTPDQIRYLIEQAEATQAHRSPPKDYPPRALSNHMAYVALADKLDGLWLKTGIDAVLARLREDQSLASELIRDWTPIDLFDPHHPFLVDELQRALSSCCKLVPPLIEVHQDGRLVVLVPTPQVAEIRACALRKLRGLLARKLFGLRVNVSNRGFPEILDARPDHEQLSEFFADPETLPINDLSKFFLIKSSLVNDSFTGQLDGLLGELGLGPSWPKAKGQTVTLYANPASLSEEARRYLRVAAHLTVLLNHKASKELPEHGARETRVLQAIGVESPQWIGAVEDGASRRTLTSLWATRLAADDRSLHERIWGGDGILRGWLEGSEAAPGLRDGIQEQGGEILDAVIDHFSQRIMASPMRAKADGGKRCLFTDAPVAEDATFNDSDKLHEVKKSAFSGRDGRLETLQSALGETHISPVSYAEYRLRQSIHSEARGRPDGLPTLVSSPATTGLFAALTLNNDRSHATLSVFDLAREQVNKGTVYQGMDAYRHRYRVARFERVPDNTEEQITFLHLILRASVRIGRPLHLFRGLPTPEKAFFAFDAMPVRLAHLIGGNRLRLEQIPTALARLEIAELLLETHGLGFEVFNRYCDPRTRLGAICLAWCRIREDNPQERRLGRFRQEFDHHVRDAIMSNEEAPLVRFGRAVARVQRQPFHSASNNEEMLVFNLSLDTAIEAWRLGQRDAESMTLAIAGELDTQLTRKGKIAAKDNRPGETLREAYLSVARQFVEEVWTGVLKGQPPAQSKRRILGSIYRMAFLTATPKKPDPIDSSPLATQE